MQRRVCIHGHFYQPNRANPWTGLVDPEPTAAPFADWNERITAECYRQNAASRRMGEHGLVERVVSTYEHISFNVGASLLQWLADHDPWTYGALLDADARSAERYGGHGSAIAQPWVHAILPLADERDRRTLVHWGARDFAHRFGRPAEGMWLPETAVDTPTLHALADEGIAFTILAPWQLEATRPATGPWRPVATEGLDTTRPYHCALPGGGRIALFPYDGELSSAVAFGGLLHDGDAVAAHIRQAFPPGRGRHELLVHLATDGESYGHHHRFGDMALARAIEVLDADPGLRLTNYAEHLAAFPPTWEARLAERTAWSCAHGIERWRSDCGCHLGGDEGWTQAWRTPLRQALDWLRAELATLFETSAGRLLDDPWAARDDYVDVLVDPMPERQRTFVAEHGGRRGSLGPTLRLLESQRHLLEAFESSAWFYDDAAGAETVLALRHAARAIELARDATDVDLEPAFVERLHAVHSNDAAEGDGAAIWQHHVLGARPDPAAVAREAIVRGLLDAFPDRTGDHDVRAGRTRRVDAGGAQVCSGTVAVTHRPTADTTSWAYAVALLGGPALLGVVQEGDGPSQDLADAVAADFGAGEPRRALAALARAAGWDPLTLTSLAGQAARGLLDGRHPTVDAAAAVEQAALDLLTDPTDDLALVRLVEIVRVVRALAIEPLPGLWWAQTAAARLVAEPDGLDRDLLAALADEVGVRRPDGPLADLGG